MTSAKLHTILLVNYPPTDIVKIRQALTRLRCKCDIIEAESFAHALQITATVQVDYVLLNSLPNNLQEMQSGAHAPVIMGAKANAIPNLVDVWLSQFRRERAEKQITTVAQQLRNPLDSILGYTRLLRMMRNLPEQAEQVLEIIERNGKIQLQLINDWLTNIRTRSSNLLPEGDKLCPQLTNNRFLVIEPDPDSRKFLTDILTEMGATLTLAGSASEALNYLCAAAEQRKFDLLVTDVHLPDEDGYSLMRKIRRMPQLDAVTLPAIALIGFPQTDDRIRCLRVGFQMYISKPVEPLELAMAIQSIFPPNQRIT